MLRVIDGWEGWGKSAAIYHLSTEDRRLESQLDDLDIAGAGADADGWAATVDDAVDVMAVEVALHGDGLGDLYGAGAGVGVEIKWVLPSARWTEPLPVESFQSAEGWPVTWMSAAAGGGFERAGDAVEVDAAAAGLGFDVAGAGVLKFDAA